MKGAAKQRESCGLLFWIRPGRSHHFAMMLWHELSLSPPPGLSLLSISISTSLTHMHTHTLPAQGHPTNTHHGTIPYLRPLLLRKHLCRMCDPLPPQSTGKAYSPFVYADMSRRQVAGLQTDGLNLSFLPSSCLPPFPKNAHCMLAPAVEPQHLLKHLSPCFRNGFACD